MSASGKKVLIVEDGEALNRMIQFLLMSKGYLIEYAHNGIEAMAILEKTRPDAIILDLMMPEMDGYELCERLKKNKQYKETPIIILSSLEACRHGNILKSMGASDYIEKPFTSSDLLEKVSTALASSVN